MQPKIPLDSAPASQRGAGLRERAGRAASAVSAWRLERRMDGKLWFVDGSAATAVEVVRCFPWSEPTRFLSLRDADGNERGFVAKLDDLAPDSRAALESGLERSSFVFDIVRIFSVSEDFELRSFVVETAQGERRFQTALDAWPREVDGGLVLEDVHGDLYRVKSPRALDAESRRLLRAFID